MTPVRLAGLCLVATLLAAGSASAQQKFSQTNLVSDIGGLALYTDPNLVNPWGLVPGTSGVFWSANNESGTSTLYNADGSIRPLVVTIPGGKATGVVATLPADSSFWIPSGKSMGRAVFIFVTQNGTVAAWNPSVNMTTAIQVAATAGAVYTGAALGGTNSQPLLYAADFANQRIDIYNRDFTQVSTPGSFMDPGLPSGYSPFNITAVDDRLYISYAQIDPSTHDEMKGAGLGFVSVFDPSGNFVRRFASNGALNAPWAIVRAPSGFGDFGGSLLVGNFGDGRINAFNFATGAFQATLEDTAGYALELDGLWGLNFGLPVSGAGVAQHLYFNAGIQDEAHGLFGYLSEFSGSGQAVCDNNSRGIGYWRKQCGGPSHGGGDRDHGKDWGDDKGKGKDKDDRDGGKGHGGLGKGMGRYEQSQGHRPRPEVPSDSLDALFACLSAASAPNVFGTNGCLTASCDLLGKAGSRNTRELAAGQLLVARLNLCSGRVCDGLAITCLTASDWVGMTVGAAADSLDAALCGGRSDSRLRMLTRMLECANAGNQSDGDDADDNDSGWFGAGPSTIGITPVGGNPARLSSGAIRFSVSAAQPAVVQMRIYDTQGRMVAEPMQSALVNGSVSVSWNGRGQDGRIVTPGNYFYRAISGAGSSSGRIVIIR